MKPSTTQPEPARSGTARSRLLLAAKFVVSAALLYWVFAQTSFDAVLDSLAGLDPVFLGLAIVATALAMPLMAARWRLVGFALGAPLGYRRLLSIVWIGFFLNQALPSSIGGDAMRIHLAWRASARKAKAVNGVILDRLLGLFAALLLAVLFTPTLYDWLGPSPEFWLIAIALAGIAAAFLALVAFHVTLGAWFTRLLLVGPVNELSRDARTCLFSRRHGAVIVALSVVIQLLQIVTVWFLAQAIGIGVGILPIAAFVPTVILITSLPISIAGWGVREQAFVFFMAFFGVAAAPALTASILLGLVWIVTSVPGAFVWVAYRHAEPAAGAG